MATICIQMNPLEPRLLAYAMIGILFGILAATVAPVGYGFLGLVVTALTTVLGFTRS
jgi:hypothetical protein